MMPDKTDRNGKGQFAKGNSGRPKGISKQAFRDLAGQAIAVLEKLMVSGRGERTRLTAATYVLDQAYGRPMQSVELTGAEFVGQLTDKIRAADPVLAEQLAALQEKVGVELQ